MLPWVAINNPPSLKSNIAPLVWLVIEKPFERLLFTFPSVLYTVSGLKVGSIPSYILILYPAPNFVGETKFFNICSLFANK